jgi:hypothetical protein
VVGISRSAVSGKTDGIGSSCEVNWLIDGRCGEGLPAIDLALLIWPQGRGLTRVIALLQLYSPLSFRKNKNCKVSELFEQRNLAI